MSENLDLVRSIVAGWERGDFSSSDWADPEIEYTIVSPVDGGTWRGRAAMAHGWGQWLSSWDGLRVQADDCRELDAERFLLTGRAVARGKTSGMDITQQRSAAVLFCLDNHRVIRLVQWWDRERALADLGLAK
jgi:hypothetical protein